MPILKHALPSINLIVNCTARKRHTPESSACARNLAEASPSKRLKQWIKRLNQGEPQKRCAVGDLYCGDSWSTIQGVTARVQEREKLNLWIASAGYGLLSEDDTIVPYSATFAPGHADSVSNGGVTGETKLWWNGLIANSSTNHRPVTSVTHLVQMFPNTPLLIGVSTDYLKAMMDDLTAAVQCLVDPNLAVIVTAGTKESPNLTPYLLPCDARLEHRLGGARSSLNARIVAYILEKFPSNQMQMPFLRKHFKNILSRAPEARTFDRKKVSDKVVESFLQKSLRKEPGLSFTLLLRRFRDSGQACEYTRFRALFRRITESTTLKP